MRRTVWREARRANRDEGLGTSMTGRIVGVAAFVVLIWSMILGDANGSGSVGVMDVVIGATVTVAGLGLLAFGLAEDYRDARVRVDNRPWRSGLHRKG